MNDADLAYWAARHPFLNWVVEWLSIVDSLGLIFTFSFYCPKLEIRFKEWVD